MITSVKVRNLARWKWEHEIIYTEWINILDWHYWVWKSSILVDAFQLVMTNTARVSFEDIITKGEPEAEVEVLWVSPEGEKFKFYWYHKLKRTITSIDKKTWQSKETQEAGKTIWEVQEYSEDEEDYVKSFKSPEQVLWIPYSIASKTFLIWQEDIAWFSKAWPTEKYDIIADSFNISVLFQIGDKATEKSKKLVTEKNVLLEDLKDINIADFDRIWELLTTKVSSESNIVKLNEQERNLLSRRESIRTLLSEYNQVLSSRQRVWENVKLISSLKVVDLKTHDEDIEKLTKLLESEATSEIEKIENELLLNKWKKTHLLELNTSKISEIEGVKNVKLRWLVSELSELQLKYNQTRVINWERFTDEYSSSLLLLSVDEITKQSQEKNVKFQEVSQSKQILVHRLSTTSSIIEKIENLTESICPTCYRWLSQDEKLVVITKFQEEKTQITKELAENTKNLEAITVDLQKLSFQLQEIQEYQKYLENKQYSLLWKQKQEEYNLVKMEEEAKVEKIKEQSAKELADITTLLVTLQSKYEKLTEKSKAKEYKDRLKELQNKTFLVEGRTYTSQEVKTTITVLEWQSEELSKNISNLLVKLEINVDMEEVYINKINQELTKNLIDLESLQLDKQTKQQELYTLSTQLSNLQTLQSRYEKVREKVQICNEHLERLEKIWSIFWKKWQPKLIIEKIIVPQLELKTNTLLDRITNWKYQVEFSLTSITQDWKESKKNTFDIMVFVEGTKQVYGSLSGWEKMNINYAIRLWITECLNELLGRQTSDILILDEAFNAIDSDASEEQILRSIKETSTLYKQIFIITHVNELKDWLQWISTVHSIVKEWLYSKLEK